MRRIFKSLLLTLGVAVALAVSSTPASAQTFLDDPPLFIGNSTLCPTSSCTEFFNGETIAISPTALTIYDQGANKRSTDTTIELIIAIPNSTSGAPTIMSVAVGGGASGTPVGTLGGGPNFGGSWNAITGLATPNGGELTAKFPAKSGSVYPVAGLPTGSGGASSDNFSNFQIWDTNSGLVNVDPKTGFFGVFVYTITGVSLGQGQYLIVDFSGGGLPVGTFAAGFSCENGDSTSVACSGGDIYSTPFTHVGLVTSTPTPEPGTMALLGTGLVAFGGFLRRRKKGNQAV